LFIHEKWFPQTAMEWLLDCDGAVAEKDRLYRTLDRMVPHKAALERHLAGKWRDLFGARFDVLLYDLTSTYFEGDAAGVDKAARGYSRDHRPDCAQLVIALVVTPEGFPLSYEVFAGNRADVTTLEEMLDGRARRIWIFDRGIVSEANLEKVRERGGQYVVGTPRHQLEAYEQELLAGAWMQISESVQVQLIAQEQETYVLARSGDRAKKEAAMRWRQVRGLMRDLIRLRRSIRKGTLVHPDKVLMRLGRLSERWPRGWRYVAADWKEGRLTWRWDRQALRLAAHREGAYLLRTNLTDRTPDTLWRMYVQLTEVEAVFRALKSELAIRPIWHWVGPRVEAHVMVAFLGYCLWVCLKQRLKRVGPGLTPWQLLDQFKRILQVEVWFKLKAGGAICLPRITQPEPAQTLLLHQMAWALPEQPPPRIYKDQIPNVWPT
jgi:transposase